MHQLPRFHSRLGARACYALRAIAALALTGCASAPDRHDAPSQRKAERGEVPPLVAVSSAQLQSGFAGGPLRESREVEAFRITRHPITWKQYDACVHAGACAPEDKSACQPSAYAPYPAYATPDYAKRSKQAPALCVGEVQAAAYCTWVGGRLPILDQWLLAARGDAPRRYAWGDEVSGCDQHPLAPQIQAHRARAPGVLPDSTEETCEESGDEPLELQIAQHAAGAAPSGVEDVLLAPGELLAGDSEAMFNACRRDGSDCVVYGIEPAAIEAVEPFLKRTAGKSETIVGHAYAFRCVLDSASKKGATP